MNDCELDAKLKSVPLPERPEEYWNDFPSQVRRQLRPAAVLRELTESWLPQFAWKFGVAFVCLVIGLLVFSQPLKVATREFFQKEKLVRQQLAALPGHLRVLMADEHGLHYLVVDKE